jgi:hypothetical protein
LELSLAKSLADCSQSQDNTKDIFSQYTKETTAGPFLFLLMGPMSDVTTLSVRLILDMSCPLGTVTGQKVG